MKQRGRRTGSGSLGNQARLHHEHETRSHFIPAKQLRHPVLDPVPCDNEFCVDDYSGTRGLSAVCPISLMNR